jgi:wobble nucleotide-excising tRNase
VGGNTLSFSSNTWSATHPHIAIFDSVFIHDNVYAGDYVDHEHKKNLYRIIVGTQGVQLARQIEKLDSNIRDANRDINTKKEPASRNLPNGTTLDTYLRWQPVEDVENKIQKKNTSNSRRKAFLSGYSH